MDKEKLSESIFQKWSRDYGANQIKQILVVETGRSISAKKLSICARIKLILLNNLQIGKQVKESECSGNISGPGNGVTRFVSRLEIRIKYWKVNFLNRI
jgi:predicted nucleotidyltransferase